MILESNTDFAHFHILRKLDLEGDVYKAYDKKNNRFVGIRLPFPRPSLKNQIEELQHSLLMQHPSSMRIYEAGNLQGSAPYIATELPKGLSLKERLAQKRVPFFIGVEILRQLLESIQFGLKHQIASRDLRPSTIYLGISPKYDLQVKILSIELEKAASESHISVSADFASLLKYIAPEIIQQGTPQENSVIFSLGVIAYQLFSDKDPFDSDISSSQMYAILQKELPPIKTLLPEYDAIVNTLLTKMLHKDPAIRFHAQQILDYIEKEILKKRIISVKYVPQVFLEIEEGEHVRNVPLASGQQGEMTIGRSERSDIRLDNVKASRFHAKIKCLYDDDFLVLDNESRNGIKVNGVRVESHLLKDQDVIDISKLTQIRFHRRPKEFVFFKGDVEGEAQFQKALKIAQSVSLPINPPSNKDVSEEEDDPSLQTLEILPSELKRMVEEERASGGIDALPEMTISARIEFNWGYLPEKLQIPDSNALRETLSSLLENLVKNASADRCILISYNNEILQCEIIRKRDKTEARLDELFNIKEDLIHRVFQTGLPVLGSFSPQLPPMSLLIFPIAWQRVTHAVLYLDNSLSKRGLSAYEVSQVELMSFYMSALLEKSSLEYKLGEAKKEIAKLQGPKETFQLKENQLTWLPASIPVHNEIEIDGERLIYETQEKTFYDFIYDSEDEPAFVFLGKQHGSLVYPGVLRLIFRTIVHAMADFPSLYTILNCLNEAILKEIGNDLRVSFLLFRWDPLNTVLNYIGCGQHQFVILRENGQAEVRKLDTPLLGAHQLGAAVHQETIDLKRHDTVIWFGEDLPQIENIQGTRLGMERILNNLKQNVDKDARSIKSGLLNMVIEHIDECTPSTDIITGTIRKK